MMQKADGFNINNPIAAAALAAQFVSSDVVSVPSVTDFSGFTMLPGLCDVHVHFREPGFSYKETVRSGSRAAARGGFTTVFTMPNLNPVSDSAEHLKLQTDIISRDACIRVLPYGAISVEQKGEALSDLEALAPNVVAFSDDGHGVQSDSLMREAMVRAKHLGKIIVAHCEDNSLLHGGYIHDGAYAAVHGHKGISSESEWRQVERDLRLVKETGCAYHVCHVSTKESVALIRQAKRDGLDVTCETAPHYLTLTEEDLQEDGRYKMNPPIRTAADRDALIEGVLDGAVDIIATDHAPHSAEEKRKGLAGSAFGIVGLETAVPVLYTFLVKPGIFSFDDLVRTMCVTPMQRFAIPRTADYSLWDFDDSYVLDPAEFLSMGRATPYAGQTLFGKCLLTVKCGQTVYQEAEYGKEN